MPQETDYVAALGQVSLFSLVSKGDLKKLAQNCSSHQYAPGEVIIREGEQGAGLFVILTGHVAVIKGLGSERERQVGQFGPGNYFGEMALVDNFPRSASVKALEAVRAFSLEQWDFRKYIQKYPSIAVEIMQVLARRLRAAQA